MRISAYCAFCAVFFSVSAFAQTSTVTFTGAIIDTCTVVASSPGVITPNADFTSLSSRNSGGLAGTATITATAPLYEVTIDAPASFDISPVGSELNTTFAADYSAAGATVSAVLNAGDPLTLLFGVTSLSIHASATKSTGLFGGGAYTLSTVVRCSAL